MIKNKKIIVLFIILIVVGVGLWWYKEDVVNNKVPKKADFVYRWGVK